jgi:hypothetical protein
MAPLQQAAIVLIVSKKTAVGCVLATTSSKNADRADKIVYFWLIFEMRFRKSLGYPGVKLFGADERLLQIAKFSKTMKDV